MLIQAADFLRSDSNLALPHKGIVKDNADPKKLGRVRALVKGIFEDTDITKLPWIYPLNPAGLGGSLTTSSFAVPELDSEITIIFPYRDAMIPFYAGYWQSSTTHQVVFDTDYPNTYGWRDSVGNILKIEKTSGDVQFTHKSGTYFKILNDGTVEIKTASNKNVKTDMGTGIHQVTGHETVSETLEVTKATVLKDTLQVKKTVTLNTDNGTTYEVVTKDSICSFTGLKHPQGCGGCKVAGTQG